MSNNTSLQVSADNEADLLAVAEAAKAEATGEPIVKEGEEAKPKEGEVKEGEQAAEKPAEGDQKAKNLEISQEEVKKAEEAAAEGLDLDTFYAEYAEKGSLSDESTATIIGFLEKAKIANPEAVLAQYMSGAASEVSQMRAAAFEVTGGEEQYGKMQAWAAENLSPAEANAFDQAVKDPNMVGIAVRGLHAQYQAATGNQSPAGEQQKTSPRVAAGVIAHQGHARLNSQKQVADLVSDPRFKSDPGFRATAEARIKASMDAKLI